MIFEKDEEKTKDILDEKGGIMATECKNEKGDILYRSKKRLIKEFTNVLNDNIDNKNITIICIGTDRSTGDSYAPFIGKNLKKYENKNLKILGTLKNPVHAKNLDEVITKIDKNSFVIAIDASLCDECEDVENIIIRNGELKPGSGVGKNLSSVGDISILGNVNIGGYLPYLVLQSTRLSVVMEMADFTSDCIYKFLIDSKIISNEILLIKNIA